MRIIIIKMSSINNYFKKSRNAYQTNTIGKKYEKTEILIDKRLPGGKTMKEIPMGSHRLTLTLIEPK
jgi:hypothetical protein